METMIRLVITPEELEYLKGVAKKNFRNLKQQINFDVQEYYKDYPDGEDINTTEPIGDNLEYKWIKVSNDNFKSLKNSVSKKTKWNLNRELRYITLRYMAPF